MQIQTLKKIVGHVMTKCSQMAMLLGTDTKIPGSKELVVPYRK
jgi:hypothetical protein